MAIRDKEWADGLYKHLPVRQQVRHCFWPRQTGKVRMEFPKKETQ